MTYSMTDTSIVVRDADGRFIPNDPTNIDRQEYQAWLAAGNTPTAAPATPTPVRTAPGDKLIAAMTDDQAGKIKLRDLLRIAGRDTMPETSPVLARAARGAGTTPKDWMDGALA